MLALSDGSNDLRPAVSIILPTFNRARFLPEAIASIRAQHFTDWGLVIVDDGSTDETPDLVPHLTAEIEQAVHVVCQNNQGAYAARNTGLDHASGKYIAFFDSDDLWLPHHLQSCVDALEANSDVDWVYGACRLIDADSQHIIAENSFYDAGAPREFMRLPHDTRGALHLLQQPDLLYRVLDRAGLYAGLQNSVIRANVFLHRRFAVDFYNEADDQLVIVRAIKEGRRFGYLDDVHVVYRVHSENSSAAAKGMAIDKKVRLMRGLIEGYEGLFSELELTKAERRALHRRLSRLYCWYLGGGTLSPGGRHRESLAAVGNAIRHWPWDWRYWKTGAATLIKALADRRGVAVTAND